MKLVPSFVFRTPLFEKMQHETWKERFFRVKQIHMEAYFRSDVWEMVQTFPNPSRVTWYVLTPINYAFIRSCYRVPSKPQLAQIMSERLRWLESRAYPLGLHIHFYRFASMETTRKRRMLGDALKWGRENGVVFTKCVVGWLNYTGDVCAIAKEFGLHMMRGEPFLHDYDLRVYRQFYGLRC